MQRRKLVVRSIVIASVAFGSGSVYAQTDTTAPVAKNLSEQKFENWPDTPACLSGAVLNGDPSKGASLILAKFKSGCSIPWHWHSSGEHVMLATGAGVMDMKDAKSVTLHAGAYAMMPAHHAHQFKCTSACTMFLYSEGVFDTHYVDADGKEIPGAEALKAKKKAK
jgi:quercetin dioxygenase-like cupin family protein